MFRLKNKRQKTYIRVYLEQENKMRDYLVGEIPIKEEIVIQKSIQFFEDKEPCYIHRGAVITRLNEEILNAIEQYPEGTQVDVSDIAEQTVGYIDLRLVKKFEIFKR